MDATGWKIRKDNEKYQMPIEYDKFSVHDLNEVMVELGYVNNDDPIYYHYMIPGTDLEIGLRALGNDLDVLGLAKYIKDNKLIMVYLIVTPSPTPTCNPSPIVTPSHSLNVTPSPSKRKFTKNSANRRKTNVNDIEPVPFPANLNVQDPEPLPAKANTNENE
ncbi:hypothetical protein Tco_1517722 [Tanacetum coccineum]